jgi:hypothetical protein
MTFYYELPAELFTAMRRGGARSRLGYRRFDKADIRRLSQIGISPARASGGGMVNRCALNVQSEAYRQASQLASEDGGSAAAEFHAASVPASEIGEMLPEGKPLIRVV